MAQIVLNGQIHWARLPATKAPTVVLLHGGLSSSASLLRTMGPRLSTTFELAAFDRRGHGRSPDDDRGFSYHDMADEVVAFIEYLDRRVYLVGHSDGANVALHTLVRRPELVRRAVLVGGNFHYDGLVDVADFTPQSPGFDEFAASYARRSPEGIEHARAVVEKSLALVKSEPNFTPSQLNQIANPVLVMVGDDDVVKLSHTCLMYESLPEAQLAVIPGASHSVLKEKPALCAKLMREFFSGPSPARTQVPLRRRVRAT